MVNLGVPRKLLRTPEIDSTKAFIQRIAAGRQNANFEVVLANGEAFEVCPGGPVRFRLVLHRKDALRRMLAWPIDRSLCEAYFTNVFDLEGDLEAVFQVAELLGSGMTARGIAASLPMYFGLPRREKGDENGGAATLSGKKRSRNRDRKAVSFHYDVSDAFYRLWLGPSMVYSGAYFTASDQSLEDAQEFKLDQICRALRLKAGDRLLDIGCGWGSLAVFAAEHYGASVQGVTLSHRQAEFANRMFQEKGLAHRCHVALQDYRDLTEDQSFDAVASVEMLHHVDGRDLPSYFEKTHALLRPGGRSYHLAVTAAPGLRKPPKYSRQYFMPDFSLTPLHTLVAHAEKRFDVLATAGLRAQYWKTALEWVRRLEEQHEAVVSEVGEEKYRIWRLSLSLMAYAFRTSALRFHHLILQRKGGQWPTEFSIPVEEATEQVPPR